MSPTLSWLDRRIIRVNPKKRCCRWAWRMKKTGLWVKENHQVLKKKWKLTISGVSPKGYLLGEALSALLCSSVELTINLKEEDWRNYGFSCFKACWCLCLISVTISIQPWSTTLNMMICKQVACLFFIPCFWPHCFLCLANQSLPQAFFIWQICLVTVNYSQEPFFIPLN